MDYFKNKYRAGLIDLKTYEKMSEVVYHLQTKSYRFVSVLGSGSYGTVLKVKHVTSDEEKAVKVVGSDRTTDGEIETWPTLQHENIHSLLSCEYVHYAHSYLFLTQVHPTTLKQEITKVPHKDDIQAFNRVSNWIKDILAAVSYLHNRNLSHMDLKSDNILISDDKIAMVTDFGYLTWCGKPVSKYGAPFLYRCPEAKKEKQGSAEVDGKKFDVWTIGTMAFEMFTGMSLLQQVRKKNTPLFCWQTHIYPILHESLQRETFSELVRKAFPYSPEIDEKLDAVRNFITSCLTINPEKRPSAHWLQQHKLLGGSFESILLEPDEDMWGKRESDPVCKENIVAVTSESSSINNNEVYDEVVKLMKIILDTVESNCNKQSPTLLDGNINSDAVAQKINENEEPSHKAPVVECNKSIPRENSLLSIESENISDVPDRQTCGKIIRNWWKRTKSAFVRTFTACVSCVKNQP